MSVRPPKPTLLNAVFYTLLSLPDKLMAFCFQKHDPFQSLFCGNHAAAALAEPRGLFRERPASPGPPAGGQAVAGYGLRERRITLQCDVVQYVAQSWGK